MNIFKKLCILLFISCNFLNAQVEKKPLIVITNDDGYGHEFIQSLTRCFCDVARVLVIAPEKNMGGNSNKLSDAEEAIIIKLQDSIKNAPVYSVSGTPSTTVRWAFQHIDSLYSKKPDLLLSGINPGVNLGASVYYSGTIGAAREGAILGVPSMAISIMRRDADLTGACKFLKKFAAHVLEANYKTKLFNINFPSGKISDSTKVVQTAIDPNGAYLDYRPFYHFYTKNLHFFPQLRLVRKEKPGSDIYEVVNGAISITPLIVEFTSYETIHLDFE